jgi:hypothetical protein
MEATLGGIAPEPAPLISLAQEVIETIKKTELSKNRKPNVPFKKISFYYLLFSNT